MFSPKGGFATYLDPLLLQLRQSGHGLRLGLHWYGALAWADDVILLSTSINGLQSMVDICQKHAEESDLVFSTDPDPLKSKTMCIAFHCEYWQKLPPIYLNGDPLPWKESVKHIGSKLHCDGTMEQDNKEKRASFIQTCMNLNQEFESLPSESQLKLFRLYNTHFSGSNCWDYQSKIFEQTVNSYNVNVKCIFNLPRSTHCWLVEELSGGNHAKIVIFKRFVKFVAGLESNMRQSIRSLLSTVRGDVRSLTGGNLRMIQLTTGIPISLVTSQLRNCRVYQAPEGEEWRLPMLQSLLEIRDDNWEIIFNEEIEDSEMDDEDIQMMIAEVCTT